MEIIDLLPQAQNAELDILKDIDRFCENYQLRYTLGYGTLLGAVRHKGFIPWDDDIDIWMPREDYDRFIKLWFENPIDGYVLVNTDTDEDFTQNFTKIRKDKTTFLQEGDEGRKYHKGIFVDIFPFDRVAQGRMGTVIQKFYSVLMMLYTRKFSPPDENAVKKLVSKFFLGIVPKSKYDYYRKKCEAKIIKSGGNKAYFCPVTFGDVSRHYPIDMFDFLIKMQFESIEFSVTSKFDECLKIRYGNYMKLPPKEEQAWKHHPIILDLEHNYEDLI